MATEAPAKQGISKICAFFKSSFTDRPNEVHGAGLTAFKNEWDAMPEKDKADIRSGIDNGTLTY
jgi:hypothetical protein